MKRCPHCRRDYTDDSLSYCLDDGAVLVDGPTLAEPPTEVLATGIPSAEAVTQALDAHRRTNSDLDQAERRKGLLAGALAILALIVAAAGGYYYLNNLNNRSVPGRQLESIAVMPFVNNSGESDLEYLADGITESLINGLSQVPNVSVKARSSVFTYKGKNVSPQQIARDLAVQAILEGRLVRIGDQVQLNVSLVDVGSNNQLWGQNYTRKLTDVLALQSEIAREVSNQLRAKLTGVEQQKIAKSYTEDTEAYQLYLRGRYYWNKRTPDGFRKSIDYFQQAIDKDPTYALAYAALAETYILIPNYRQGKPEEFYPKARAAAERAIEMDPALAEAHNARASILGNYEWKFAEAEAEFQKTLELNPNYASGHQWYAEFLQSMGRHPESIAEMKRAQDLDPLSLIINGLVGVFLRTNGRSEEALAQLQKTLEMDPNFPRTHLFLAETYQSLGRYDEAVDEFAKAFVLAGGDPQGSAERARSVKAAYRAEGPRGYFRAMAESVPKSAAGAPPPVVLAYYWANAGDTDKAFAILEKAYQDHDDTLLMLKDGRLKTIESDPRYGDLLRRVGLPE